jgi:lysophospholipase L1-like esterase
MRQVMLFGDSNTHGTAAMAARGGLDRLPEAERWGTVCATTLGEGWQVVVEGHPGRTTVHPDPVMGGYHAGITALPILLDSHRPLDVVVIMLGTNDLKHRFSLTPLDIAHGVERLLDCIGSSNAGPGGAAPQGLVVSPVPVVETGIFAEMFQGGAAKAQRLAAALSEVAARRGIPFLDAGTVTVVDPVDGIHLDAAAHAAIGRAVAGKLEQMLNGR